MPFDTTGDFFWMFHEIEGRQLDKAHLPLSLLKAYFPEYFERLTSHFVFMFVRDPYARAISAFNEARSRIVSEADPAGETVENRDAYVAALNDFIGRLTPEKLDGWGTDYSHFIRQRDMAYLGAKLMVDCVMQSENLVATSASWMSSTRSCGSGCWTRRATACAPCRKNRRACCRVNRSRRSMRSTGMTSCCSTIRRCEVRPSDGWLSLDPEARQARHRSSRFRCRCKGQACKRHCRIGQLHERGPLGVSAHYVAEFGVCDTEPTLRVGVTRHLLRSELEMLPGAFPVAEIHPGCAEVEVRGRIEGIAPHGFDEGGFSASEVPGFKRIEGCVFVRDADGARIANTVSAPARFSWRRVDDRYGRRRNSGHVLCACWAGHRYSG